MRTRDALLVIGCCLVACGGQVGSKSESDGGPARDASTGSSSGGAVDSGARDGGSSSSSGGAIDSGAVADAADEGVACGVVDGGGVCVPCPASLPTGTCNFNGVTCNYPGGQCTCSSGCAPGECCPATCAQLGFPCGQSGDGCGGILQCRTCPTGQTCGAAGACTSADAGADAGCVVATCPSSTCGMIDDGCGGKIQCGDCYWECVLSGP